MVAIWQEEEATLCPRCGTYRWEHERPDHGYVPDNFVDYVCRDIEAFQALNAEHHDPEVMRGWKTVLTRGGDDGY